MVRKSLKGVRSLVSIKEENKMHVNEMAIPTRKSGKKLWFHWLFKVTQWGLQLAVYCDQGRILIDEIKESTS